MVTKRVIAVVLVGVALLFGVLDGQGGQLTRLPMAGFEVSTEVVLNTRSELSMKYSVICPQTTRCVAVISNRALG